MEHVAPRYRSEDYARIREIMDDGKKMPASFLGWKEAADRQLAVAKAGGVVTKRVTIDPEKFVAFCSERQLPGGSGERTAFVLWITANEDEWTVTGGKNTSRP